TPGAVGALAAGQPGRGGALLHRGRRERSAAGRGRGLGGAARRTGTRGVVRAAATAARSDRAGLLRRLHAVGDRGAHGDAARHSKDAHAGGHASASSAPRRGRRPHGRGSAVSEPIDPREQLGEHAEWDELAVAWALSALDPEDEERFAEHLPGCTRCTATVRESLYTVADLAYALPDEAPPPSLKSRLMAAVAAEPRTPGALPPQAPAEPEPEEEWPLGEPHPGSPGYGI